MQTEKTPDLEENYSDNTFSKSNIITAIAVFMISIFIITLFLINKAEWEKKMVLSQTNDATKTDKNIEITPKNNENGVVLDKALAEAAKEDSQQMSKPENIENEENTEKISILESENSKLKAELQSLKNSDSLRVQSVNAMSSYKIYGLYRDKSGKQNEAEVAKKFHIKTEKAIKTAEINGEKAFVIPVRGVHIAKNGDTAFSIARKYYKNEKLANLIEDFNGEIKAGMIVFLPFN